MATNKPQEFDMVLSKQDKDVGMSDATYQDMMREAFPVRRHGSVKSALYAAYRFMAPKVRKPFTERRVRSLWEGTARRFDAEEASVLKLAIIEEAKREQIELRARLARLDTALATIDADFHGPQMAAHRAASAGLGRVDRTRTGRD